MTTPRIAVIARVAHEPMASRPAYSVGMEQLGGMDATSPTT
jgi:hypothetical protein